MGRGSMATISDQPTELELLRRLFARSSFIPVERAVELVVGGLPPALADEVPLPSGTRLVGSAVESRQGRLASLLVVLDAKGKPDEVVSAYEPELRERGWEPSDDPFGPMRGGFVPGPASDNRTFRRGAQGPLLMVAAAVAAGEVFTDLQLRLDWEMQRHLKDRPDHLMALSGWDRMPRLLPPRGMAMERQGGGGGGGRWNSEAKVDTDRPVTELEAHFASQLLDAGWTRVAGRADDVVAWSSWRLPGEGDWRGVLLVLAAFGAEERSLTLRIEETKPDDGGSWGQGFSFESISS
jgi:hypothetical protein